MENGKDVSSVVVENQNQESASADSVIMENGQDVSSVAVENQTQESASKDIPASRNDTKDRVVADDRKLFVGGIHPETGEQELRDHFGKYGEIQHIKLKIDPATGRSRGFAFIVFESSESLSNVEAAGDHVINGKKVDPKKAKVRQGKIFVGGLTAELTDEDIKSHFGQFGNIVEAQMPFDKVKNQRKGFCFILFESEQSVRNLLRNPKQNINGKEVDVKRAESKPDQAGGSMMGGRGGRGARGGARGARGGRGGYGTHNFNQGYFGGYEQQGYGSYEQQAQNYYGSAPYYGGGFGQRYQPY